MSRKNIRLQAVEVKGLCKSFGATKALNQVALGVEEGEMVALIGASGSGKSTLLKHLSGLMVGDDSNDDDTDCVVRALNCTVQVNGDITTEIRRIRARTGFIFQQFNLVGRLPLLINVLTGRLAHIPTWRSVFRWFTHDEKKMAMQALHKVGMAEYAKQRASTLSGGQQQRAAIARALIQGAELILADEPIASLDPESSRKVMRILKKINVEQGITVLVSLHQVDFAMQFCQRIIGLKKGCVFYDGSASDLTTEILQDLYGSEFSDVEESLDIFTQLKHHNVPKAPIDREKSSRSLIPQVAAVEQ